MSEGAAAGGSPTGQAPDGTPAVLPVAVVPHTRRWRITAVALLTQAASVLFAVLLALAVDQWWENRENLELGQRAMGAVAAELRGNLESLESSRDTIEQNLAALTAALRTLQRDPDADTDIAVNYQLALVSSSAWQTAQFTRALHFVPIDQAVRVARVYELQNFVARAQDQLAERIASIGGSDRQALVQTLRDVQARYTIVQNLRTSLAHDYRCILADLEPGSAAAPPICDD